MGFIISSIFLVCCAVIYISQAATTITSASGPGSRIVNGYPAPRGEFPHQVALLLTIEQSTHFCGGALVAANWVITAAHCVTSVTSANAILGILSLSEIGVTGTIVAVTQIVQHPNYTNESVINDLALLRLEQPVAPSDVIQTIPLSDVSLNSGVYLRVSGWGRVSEAESGISDVLNYVGLTTITNEECGHFYTNEVIQEGVVCAEGATTQNICDGDAGSPLISGGGNSSVLVGIGSFTSTSGCESRVPSGFTRISTYKTWIEQVIGA